MSNILNAEWPAISVTFISSSTALEFSWPKYSASFTGHTDNNNLGIKWPKYSIELGGGGRLEISSPPPSASFSAHTDEIGTLAVGWPKYSSKFSSITQKVQSFTISWPKYSASFSGSTSTDGTLAIQYPKYSTQFKTFSSSPVCFVFNLDTGELTQFTNFEFESFKKIGDTYYGTKGGKIYEIGGDTDEGTNIDVTLKTGSTDFDSSFLKSIQDIYLGLASDGVVNVRLMINGTLKDTITLSSTSDEYGVRRVKVPMGTRGTHFGVQVGNVNGADIKLDGIEFRVKPQTRRIP